MPVVGDVCGKDWTEGVCEPVALELVVSKPAEVPPPVVTGFPVAERLPDDADLIFMANIPIAPTTKTAMMAIVIFVLIYNLY